MDNHRGPGQQAAPQAQLVFVGGLHIVAGGGTARRAAPWQAQQPRHLPRRKRGLKMRRRAKGGGA